MKDLKDKQPKTKEEILRDKRIRRNCFCCGGFLIIVFVILGLIIFRGFVSADREGIPVKNQTKPNPPSASPAPSDTAPSDPVASDQTNESPSPTDTPSETGYNDTRSCEQVSTPSAKAISVSTNDPGLKQDVDAVYYPVYGATSEQIYNQINQCGPKDEEGSWAGLTNWNIIYNYQFQPSGNSCKLINPTVGLKIDIYYPEWKAPENYAPGLENWWQEYINGLIRHENGHRDLGIAAAQDLFNQLSSFADQATCEELTADAESMASSVLDKLSSDNKAYDSSTDHGRNQN